MHAPVSGRERKIRNASANGEKRNFRDDYAGEISVTPFHACLFLSKYLFEIIIPAMLPLTRVMRVPNLRVCFQRK